jgi:Ca2+-binding EF-hand superfamily protein
MAARNLVFALILALLGGARTVAWAAEAAQETPAEAEESADNETAGEETGADTAMDEEAESEAEDPFVRPKRFSLIPQRPEGSIPAKITRYARRLIDEYDANADGQLQQPEWERFLLGRYDQDADGVLRNDELKDLFALRLAQLFDQFDKEGDGLLSTEEWDRLFVWRYDDNGDGYLQPEELKELLLLRLKQIFRRYDLAGVDGEGVIDWNELGAVFLDWYDNNRDGLLHPQESMLLPLWVFDTNRDRQLQPAEIKQILRYRAQQLLQGYDRDQDGKLQEAEVNEKLLGRYDKNDDQLLDEVELVQWATDEFDKDGKVGLDWQELGQAFVTCFDNDGNKQLSAPEVGWALVACHDQNADQWLEEHELGPLLWRYDANVDGQLNRNEVAWIFLECYDEDGDGQLARHEFDLSLLGKYGSDGDGELQEAGLARLRGDLWSSLAADVDSDGLLTEKELTDRVAMHGRGIKMWLMLSPEDVEAYFGPIFNPVSVPPEASGDDRPDTPTQADRGGAAAGDPRERMKYFLPAARLKGVPGWFLQRDTDGDGQVSLSEFTPKPSQAALAEFYKYDANRDGVITAKEAGGSIVPVRKPRPKSQPKEKPESKE